MEGRERIWRGTLLILTMVAQWKKMLQSKPAFIQSIFGKNYRHLELSFHLKILWKQDTAPKHFQPFWDLEWDFISLSFRHLHCSCLHLNPVSLCHWKEIHICNVQFIETIMDVYCRVTWIACVKCTFSLFWIKKAPIKTVSDADWKVHERKPLPSVKIFLFTFLKDYETIATTLCI